MTRDPSREAADLRHRLRTQTARYDLAITLLEHLAPGLGELVAATPDPRAAQFAAAVLLHGYADHAQARRNGPDGTPTDRSTQCQ